MTRSERIHRDAAHLQLLQRSAADKVIEWLHENPEAEAEAKATLVPRALAKHHDDFAIKAAILRRISPLAVDPERLALLTRMVETWVCVVDWNRVQSYLRGEIDPYGRALEGD